MRFHVTVLAFDTIMDEETIQALRQVFGQKVAELQQSGSLVEGGVFLEKRGGFFVLDVDSATHLFKLLAPLNDYGRIEVHPLISFETLGAFFQGTL
ncbi:MAG: muconolactone Delta-isomerase family protein [Rhodothermales bacterium]